MSGYAKHISFKHLTTEMLTNTIHEMTTNRIYSNKAKQILEILTDDLVNPMDEMMWWIEHVIKFRGAKHLKSHAVNMNWFSYLLFDVFGVLILSVLVTVYLLYAFFKRIFKTKSKQNPNKLKRN